MNPSAESTTIPIDDVSKTRALTEQASNDSIASVIFPWRNRRAPYVPRNETGRQVRASSFYLCLMSAFLFSSGIQLICATLWAMSYKIPYMHLTEGSFYIDSVTFILCSAIMCIPCSFLAWSSHNKKNNYAFLPVLMILLGFSMSMLSAGASVGFLYKNKMHFEPDTKPPKLVPNEYQKTLYSTMMRTIARFDDNDRYQCSWNIVQDRLKCCGVNSADDWMELRGSLPASCYLDSSKRQIYNRGCINLVAYDLSWELSFLTTVGLIGFLVQMSTLLLACFIYVREKSKRRNIIV